MKKTITLLSLLVACQTGHGQVAKNNSQEEVYLHLNRTDLLSGETLLFSAYVRSAATRKLSSLSSILYVELLDSEGSSVHQTKIKLVDGRGQGEYFISSLLTTGNYHLVAYTRWMKNFNTFYHQPIAIINPFENYSPMDSVDNLVVEFFPEGGSLLAESQNLVGITTRSSNRQYRAISGRIVSSDGETATNFETDQFGLGSASFLAKKGLTYRAVIENGSDGFLFFDLPTSCSDCLQLKLNHAEENLQVELSGLDGNGYLVVSDMQNEHVRREVSFPNTIRLSGKNLPSDILKIQVESESGKLLAERIFRNNEIVRQKELSIKKYSLREKVETSFDVVRGGNFSVSVNKVHDMSTVLSLENSFLLRSRVHDVPKGMNISSPSLENFLLTARYKASQSLEDEAIKYRPEYRADLVQGKISRNSIENKLVTLAMPGQDFRLHVSKTSEDGQFLIGFPPPEESAEIYLSVIDSVDYEVTLDSEFYSDYPSFEDVPMMLDSALVAKIITRSINIQIENAYYSYKEDTTLIASEILDQFEGERFYLLDDYVRFPTLKETFREYITEVGVLKGVNNSSINLRLQNRKVDDVEHPHMILVDGLPTKASRMLEISPYAIKSIRVVNHSFYFGEVRLSGIISLRTFKGEYRGADAPKNYVGLQQPKSYEFPNHQIESKLPDQRAQLFWNPNVDSNNGKLAINFYTSDVPGTYEICVEGIGKNGETVSLRKQIVVE